MNNSQIPDADGGGLLESARILKPQEVILTKALGTVNDSVTVDVGEGSRHEQAVSRPCSAASLLGSTEVPAGVDVGAPLINTDSTMSEAIDSICWASATILRRTVGAGVIVEVSTTVVVAKMRCVDI